MVNTKHSFDDTERRYTLLFTIYSVVAIFEGLLVLYWILSIPGDAKNALAAGLSVYRIILVGGVVGILLAFMGGLAGYYFNNKARAFVERHLAEQRYLRLWSVVGLLLAFTALVPAVEWGRWGAAFTRLLPFVTWLSVLSLQWAVALRVAKGNVIAELVTAVRGLFFKLKPVLLPVFVGLVAVYVLAVGLYPAHQREDYWYENGIPILLWQIIIAVLAGMLFSKYQTPIRSKLGKRTDLVMFLTIFLMCGALWAFSPLEHSFFNPKPLPPNYDFYPYSDAARFDLQAQSALLGLGLDRGTPVDRPFYPSVLGLIHLFTGQEYSANVMLQAFLFGVFPALIYLICSEMGARNWGVVSSLVVAFWGQNALLVHSRLNTASPKQMLTDFPLAIVLSLLMYVTVRWLKAETTSLNLCSSLAA